MKTKLRDRVIVRREEDHWLLYNGDNGALVKVPNDNFARYLSSEDGDVSERELHCWLLNEGFLPSSHNSNGFRIHEPAEPIKVDGFFDLRSRQSPLNVLWAITPACNLRCIYCFPDATSHAKQFKRPPLEALARIADQIIDAKVFRITLSGGECLLYPQVWELVDKFRAAGLTVVLLSNGGPVTDRVGVRAKVAGVTVGISIDAPEESINMLTRGPGAYLRAINAIKRLIHCDVPVVGVTTVTKHYFQRLETLTSQLEGLGVRAITFQDLKPFGTRAIYDSTRLTADFESALRSTLEGLCSKHPKLVIGTSELLFCLAGKNSGQIMQCPAGDNFAYIDFYGNVFPCTALPTFVLGNLLQGDQLIDLWRNSKAINALRALKQAPFSRLTECRGCPRQSTCDGGCRGDALFYRGDLFGRPSRCQRDYDVKQVS